MLLHRVCDHDCAKCRCPHSPNAAVFQAQLLEGGAPVAKGKELKLGAGHLRLFASKWCSCGCGQRAAFILVDNAVEDRTIPDQYINLVPTMVVSELLVLLESCTHRLRPAERMSAPQSPSWLWSSTSIWEERGVRAAVTVGCCRLPAGHGPGKPRN